MASSDSCLLEFISLCNLLPSNVDRPNNLFLTNRIWQRWLEVKPTIRSQKTVTSLLLADSFAGFDEADCHLGEAHVGRHWGWFSLHSHWETESLSPKSLKWLEPVENYLSEFGNGSFSSWTLRGDYSLGQLSWLQSCERPWNRRFLPRFLTHRKKETMKVCSFKFLKFRVTCTATDN